MGGLGFSHPDWVIPCIDKPDRTSLNPTLPEIYEFIDGFFSELLPLFKDNFVHLGCDELRAECWSTNPLVQRFMKEKTKESNNTQTWNVKTVEKYFFDKVVAIATKYKPRQVIWFDFIDQVPETDNIFVQAWMYRENLGVVTSRAKQALYSAGWYLDVQVVGPLSHYLMGDAWIDFYNNEPEDRVNSDNAKKLIHGGEPCMWGEQVDSMNIESQVWPRAAAAAERLWTQKNKIDPIEVARNRLNNFRCHIAVRGIHSNPVGPNFCRFPNETNDLKCNYDSKIVVNNETTSTAIILTGVTGIITGLLLSFVMGKIIKRR